MPVFRPSCVVNFKLKFDSALTVEKSPPKQTLRSAKDAPAATKVKTSEPLIVAADDASDVSWVMARVPRTLSLELTGYRQAHKFSMSFAFRDMPIDPRTVQAASVEIHMGAVSDEDFAAGFRGKESDGRYRSILQTRSADGSPNATTLKMVGIVDEWEVTQSKEGGEVTMSGRDLRGVLLDTPIGPGDVKDTQLLDDIDWSKPINEVVAQILAFNVFFDGFKVVVNAADWPDGVLPSPGLSKGGVLRHRKGARGTKKAAPAKPQGASSNLNFWDLIVRSCYLVGGIPYIRGTALCIRPSATVYDKLRGPIDPDRNPTPFAGGAARSTDAMSGDAITPGLRTRLLVYGRDTESVRINRKYQGWRKPKIIQCVAVDLDTTGVSYLVQGLWPPQSEEEARKTSRTAGKDAAKEEVLTIPVPGVKDEERLTVIARSIYEEIGRGELGGEVVTTNLASFGGDNADPDLLRLEPGDGVEFQVDTRAVRNGVAPLVSSYTDNWRRSFDEQVDEVMTKITDRNLARVIVATARGQVAELQSFFRVQNVKYAWDKDSGIKISFDFQNYVVARAQVEDAPSQLGSALSLASGAAKAVAKAAGSLGNL